MKKILKTLTVTQLVILLAFSVVGFQKVSAETNNAGCFNVITETSDGWSVNSYSNYYGKHSYITITKSGEYYIEQNCDCDTTNYHYASLTIENAVEVTITLVNVEMKLRSNSPVQIKNSDSNVTFILVGNNVFSTASDNASGIQFTPSENGSLTITSYTAAYLTVQGGNNSSAIGGGRNNNSTYIYDIPGSIYITGNIYLSLSGGVGYNGNPDGYAIGTSDTLAENLVIDTLGCYFDSSYELPYSATNSACSINFTGQTLTTSDGTGEVEPETEPALAQVIIVDTAAGN